MAKKKVSVIEPTYNYSDGGENSIEYCQWKATTLAGKCREIFVAAIFVFHTGKPVVDVNAIQLLINHLLDVRSPESVLS
ncbi:MAG: hypothetical protein KJ649_00975 [Proteobacteria bacterium]|nr:hypothetical protein [Pseudomonadota bacterium]